MKWKEDFKNWLISNMYIYEQTADFIVMHVEHYYNPAEKDTRIAELEDSIDFWKRFSAQQEKEIKDLEAKLAQAIEFQKRAFSYGANGASWEQFFTAQEKEAQESEKGGL